MPPDTRPLPELASFLETLSEPHILCDRDYRIIAANAAYRTAAQKRLSRPAGMPRS